MFVDFKDDIPLDISRCKLGYGFPEWLLANSSAFYCTVLYGFLEGILWLPRVLSMASSSGFLPFGYLEWVVWLPRVSLWLPQVGLSFMATSSVFIATSNGLMATSSGFMAS